MPIKKRIQRASVAVGIVLLFGLSGCLGRVENLGSAPPPSVTAPASPRQQPTSATAPASPTQQPTTIAVPTATVTPAATVTRAPASPTTVVPTSTPATRPTAAQPVAPAVSGALPVRLQIPDLKIDVAVVEMGWQVIQTKDGLRSEWDIPKNEAGHHLNSARLGEAGNLVISGHNNIFGQVFNPISQAWQNDRRAKIDDYTDQSDVLNGVILKLFDAAGAERDYVVSAFYRLKETGASAQQQAIHARYMQPTDHEQVTLITCWPPTSNTHRLIVVANPLQ